MPGRQTYVLYSLEFDGYLEGDEKSYTVHQDKAGRFSEGTALDIVVERANIREHSKGFVLMLAPEYVSR